MPSTSIKNLIAQINTLKDSIRTMDPATQTQSSTIWQLKKVLADLLFRVGVKFQQRGLFQNAFMYYYEAYTINKLFAAKKILNLACQVDSKNNELPPDFKLQGSTPSEYFYNGLSALSDVEFEPNFAVAAAYFSALVESHHVGAINILAFMHLHGKGVPQNAKEAIRLYRLGVNLNDSDSQNAMGKIYEKGEHIEADPVKADALYLLSAAQGNPSGQINHACTLIQRSRGTPESEAAVKKALDLFHRAAKQGEPLGEYNLGCLYKTGRGVLQNDFEAMRRFRLALPLITAENLLASYYRDGKAPTSPTNAVEYREDIRNFSETNKIHAINALKQCLAKNPDNFACQYHSMWANATSDLPANFDALAATNLEAMRDALTEDSILTTAVKDQLLRRLPRAITLPQGTGSFEQDSLNGSDSETRLPGKKVKTSHLSPTTSYLFTNIPPPSEAATSTTHTFKKQ